MALLTAVGADGGLMVMSIVAVFDDRLLPRLSVTWKLNAPAVLLALVGTKVRSPAVSSAAVTRLPEVIAAPLSASVPSLGSEVMVTLASVSAATASEKPKSVSLKVKMVSTVAVIALLKANSADG